MGCTMKGKSSMFSDLEVRKIESECIVDGNVLFWNSGKSVIVTAGSSCQLYSVATGEQVKTLFTCKSKIVASHFHPARSHIVVVLTEDGELVQYNLETDVIKRSRKLVFNAEVLNNQNVYKFSDGKGMKKQKFQWSNEMLNDVERRKFLYGVPVIVANISNWVFWASWCLNDESHCHVTVFLSSNGKHVEKVNLPKLPLKKCYKNFAVRQTSDRSVLYVGMGVNCIEVKHYINGRLLMGVNQLHYLGYRGEITCLTLSSRELSFATADRQGVILVWQDILRHQPIKTAYHWHTVDIHDLAISDEGIYLYSGGDENVLVKWSFLTNEKNFLPRLASSIRHISIAEPYSLIAVSLASNEIDLIDANFQKISIIKKYSIYAPWNGQSNRGVLTVDPRNDNLVLNGTPGHLQFISTQENFKFLYMLDVGRSNYMTGDKNLVNLSVTHARFSRNGSWLVTAEERKDNFLREYRMKFWHFNETKQCFVLNTSVELPHEENDIHSLEISSEDLVATSGSDKQFKLWSQFESSDLHGMKTVWSVLGWGKYKLLPSGPIDFCEDSTLVAVGFGPSLTLWDTNSCKLKCSLMAPFKREELKFVKFGREEHSHLVVIATDYNITTWNVITLTMSWTVDLKVSFLVGDFFNSYMCAFSKSGSLFVFSPGSTSPELVMENVTQSEVVAAYSALSVSNESNPSRLYFINSKRELFYLRSKEDAKSEEMTDLGDVHVTPFSAQVPQRSGGGVTKTVAEYVPTKSKKNSHYILSILDAPSHTLQNPLRFCYDFLESLTATVQKSANPPDLKGKEPGKKDEVVEIVDSNDGDEIIEIVDRNDYDALENDVSEDSLWMIVNDLFK